MCTMDAMAHIGENHLVVLLCVCVCVGGGGAGITFMFYVVQNEYTEYACMTHHQTKIISGIAWLCCVQCRGPTCE